MSDLLSYEAAQKRLGGVSRSLVKKLAAAQEIEAITVGRRTVFIPESLDAYIERRRTARSR